MTQNTLLADDDDGDGDVLSKIVTMSMLMIMFKVQITTDFCFPVGDIHTD